VIKQRIDPVSCCKRELIKIRMYKARSSYSSKSTTYLVTSKY
jgi:hypothetical protein